MHHAAVDPRPGQPRFKHRLPNRLVTGRTKLSSGVVAVQISKRFQSRFDSVKLTLCFNTLVASAVGKVVSDQHRHSERVGLDAEGRATASDKILACELVTRPFADVSSVKTE